MEENKRPPYAGYEQVIGPIQGGDEVALTPDGAFSFD